MYNKYKNHPLRMGHKWMEVFVGRYEKTVVIDELNNYVRGVNPNQLEEYFNKTVYGTIKYENYKEILKTITMTKIEAIQYVYDVAKTKMVWVRLKNNKDPSPYWCYHYENPSHLEFSLDLKEWHNFERVDFEFNPWR